ncbi:hypothetical protein [Sagittula stellata]|uniref:Caspase family p20 domain-containing protein n=1 Tax=Sagittula stellata (strain ATCC 700073 / DSM 11524 / E-37) TaxID=388399 RepID=A3KAP8_SAGS3|nr:hypothetical protein [Sagittula stellata]EBA05754.1 hypothetical protein SSE37_03045 [Sagittula stellata E-37]
MRTAALALTLLGLSAAPLTAQDWQAIVVGQPGPGTDVSLDDALHAGEALKKGGVPLLDVIRDMPRARLTDTLAVMGDVPRLVFFYSGRMPSGSLAMQDGAMPLDTILQSAAGAGTQEMILMLENCSDESPIPSRITVPDAPDGMALMVVASAGPGARCEPGERLSDALRAMSEEQSLTGDLLARLDGMFTVGSVPSPVVMTGAGPQDSGDSLVELLPEDVILLPALDGDFSLGGGESGFEETIGVDEVIEIVLPARVPDIPDMPEIVEDNSPVITFAALPTAQIAALPIVAGLPDPSILVGLIEGVTDASLEVDPQPDAPSTALASFFDDNAEIATSLATLRNMRQNDPEMYSSLLATGAFDPQDDRVLAKVIQSELSRMNCYRGRVDGQYGRRSREGSSSYFDELKKKGLAALDDPAATVDLFRLILGNDDIRCPDPVVARPRTNNPARQQNATRQTQSSPVRQQPAQTVQRNQPVQQQSTPSRQPNFSGARFGSGIGR